MEIKQYVSTDYTPLMEVWESAVRATHDFLKPEDFNFFQAAIPNEYLPNLAIYILEDAGIKAFAAVSGTALEMLFVHANARGKGYGGKLLQFAIAELGIQEVDVNEQNEQAVGFYRKYGFRQVGRLEKDGAGKDYPILQLSL
ncbi:GNAT family N-acetyltransferase [Sphingobacterium lactis]|uniref:GNAT family N-acetyltransferase n=1 Tax=Sphingobacterium lactis TaxID=797291 RepID=UPI003DA61941